MCGCGCVGQKVYAAVPGGSDGVARQSMGISFHKSSAIRGQSFSPRTLQLLDQAGNFVFSGHLIWWFGGGAWKATA